MNTFSNNGKSLFVKNREIMGLAQRRKKILEKCSFCNARQFLCGNSRTMRIDFFIMSPQLEIFLNCFILLKTSVVELDPGSFLRDSNTRKVVKLRLWGNGLDPYY